MPASIRQIPNGNLEWEIGFEIPEFEGYRLPPGHTAWIFYQDGELIIDSSPQLRDYREVILQMKKQLENWLRIVDNAIG